MLIDLHCHILPGVDDGAKDYTMGIKLARAAVDQGIQHSLLTPHHMDGMYTNHKQDVLEKAATFQQQLKVNGVELNVYPSQEVHLTGELIESIENDDILFMDETEHYLLLELPHSGIPEYTEQIVFELIARGITPVIAHPERNHGFQKHPEKLFDFVQQGCLTQLTSSSYMGVFGPEVQRLTEKFIDANLGSVFASDAHNFEGRRYLMKEAFAKLENDFGADIAERYQDNARNILNGDPVDVVDIKMVDETKKRKKKFWLF